MQKKMLKPQEAKKEFINSIHNWLMRTLDSMGNEEYKKNFYIQDSSIMCELPTCYFNNFDIPEGMKIEMKFTVKKS
jgi:hypothetical protein